MTFPDTSLERTGVDPEVSAMIHGVAADARPPTDRQNQQNGYAAPVAERVYAPASERVPVTPVPGHQDVVNHTDATTPERVAASAPYVQPASTWDYRPHEEPAAGRGWLALGLSVSWLTVLGASLGIWLFLRWQRERNKPINRLRRQAKQAAGVLRERVPTTLLTSRVRSIR